MTCDGAHALIAPYYGSGSGETCSSVTQPLPTVTTKARFGMAMPVTHHGRGNRARDVAREPLPTITGAHRGELAFIAASFDERDGQAPRVHSIDDPTPTICAQGGVVLVRPGRDFDILFRMLEPHELAAAMGFTSGESRYEFTGTKTDVVRQIGNAVPVNLAAALVEALMSPL
jgi:DNA (cytosine-5)-methyltransferase 1